MEISKFVEKVKSIDERNIFSKLDSIDEYLPDELYDLYGFANPVDVEISMDGMAVRFVPYEELNDIQAEYSLGDDRFIFATCNSDPIYVYMGKVYSCYHGSKKIEDELIADCFADFLDLLDE